MFTGLITHVGKVSKIKASDKNERTSILLQADGKHKYRIKQYAGYEAIRRIR